MKFNVNNKKLYIGGLVFVTIAALITGYIAYSQRVERTARQAEHPELELKAIDRGEGNRTVQNGDTVEIHYKIYLEDDTIIKSTYENGVPFVFTVGDGNVIQAWEIGIEGMKIGEKREITSPASLAYGSGGTSENIPPNAKVITEIELISIK